MKICIVVFFDFPKHPITTVINVIKLFLVEIWKFQISPKAKTASIGYFKKVKQFYSIVLITNSALFSHFSAGSDIVTIIFQFLNFGEIQISFNKSFITSTTATTAAVVTVVVCCCKILTID